MAHVAANGIQVHVQRIAPKVQPGADGRHPTAVFIHGIGADTLASFYFTLAAPLSSAGVEVIAYDLRGHGRSGGPPTGYRISDFTADLSGLLDALEVPGPVHLVGNSYGGTVAFSYALEAPERVASVVMIESEPATEAWSRKMARVFEVAVAPRDHPDALNWVAERYSAHSSWLAKAVDQILRTTMAHDIPGGPLLSRDEIQSVRCPVMAILGSESEFVDQTELESLLPRCRTETVSGHEHSVLVEAPRAVRDLLLPWIAEHHRPSLTHPSTAGISQA